MINETSVTVRGNVATDPVLRITSESSTIVCSFRIAVTSKRYSSEEKKLVDVETSFYTVTCWRALAEHVVASVSKGEGVVVTGRLRIREFLHEGAQRTSADIVADAVGHDLLWGTSSLSKSIRVERVSPDQVEADQLADEVALTPVDGADTALAGVGAAAF